MKIFDFYKHINIIIFTALIILSFLFLFPKNIETSYQNSFTNKSCSCIGFKYNFEENFKIDKYCLGINLKCQTFNDFKLKATRDDSLCKRKNDFYRNSDQCYLDAAKQVAAIDKSFDRAIDICDKISNYEIKSTCNRYVIVIRNGGVIF